MNLTDIVENLENVDDTLCIVAKKPWTAASESRLVWLTVNSRVPSEILAEGYQYFLEVSVALDEVVSGWPTLSLDKRVQLIIYYAENDAFPEWVYQIQ